MGHNLGLWHTFHGVSEVRGCTDPCREVVHELTDPKADIVGMLCFMSLCVFSVFGVFRGFFSSQNTVGILLCFFIQE